MQRLRAFLIREWLLVLAAFGAILSGGFADEQPTISVDERDVIWILAGLFWIVSGLKHTNVLSFIAEHIERGRRVAPKLILLSFFLSMFMTNDAVLILIVPVTLSLSLPHTDWLVILEALTVNAGSALTPIGNPQNLFLYWFYHLNPTDFIGVIAPFSLLFLMLLLPPAFAIRDVIPTDRPPKTETISKAGWFYVGMLIVILLGVMHLLPLWPVALVPLYALLFDRQVLRIDYSLLAVFVFFFIIANHLAHIYPVHLDNPREVFLYGTGLSQIISNVPTTILLAKFTPHWPALLWGVNAGGFGTLFGSLANLIAWRIYLRQQRTLVHPIRFTLLFLGAGLTSLWIAVGWYFWLTT